MTYIWENQSVNPEFEPVPETKEHRKLREMLKQNPQAYYWKMMDAEKAWLASQQQSGQVSLVADEATGECLGLFHKQLKERLWEK